MSKEFSGIDIGSRTTKLVVVDAAGKVQCRHQADTGFEREAYSVEQFLRERFDLPTLHLETDYAESDTEQMRVRIEAYLEMLS